MNDALRRTFRALGRASASADDLGVGSVSALGDALPADRRVRALGGGLVLALAWLLLPPGFRIAGVLALVALAALVSSVEIVQAYENRALTVLGANWGLLRPGLHLVPPFVSRTYEFDMRVETIDVPTQEAITEDNSPVTADAVVYVRVVDAERAFLGVDDYRRATALLAQTALRAAIGDMHLDETLSERERINERIRRDLQGPTDEWGVEVEMVEVQEVLPTRTVLDAMEEQTSAERRRRAMILEAQGRRRSAVEAAEGDRAAAVIAAEGEKTASVLDAQGDAIATVLRARAAESMGERAVVDRGLETLAEIGAGDSTAFVLPQELTSLLGRYGRTLSGSDVAVTDGLESRSFDADERELLGLDTVDELVAAADAATNGGPAERESEPAGGPAGGPTDRR